MNSGKTHRAFVFCPWLLTWLTLFSPILASCSWPLTYKEINSWRDLEIDCTYLRWRAGVAERKVRVCVVVVEIPPSGFPAIQSTLIKTFALRRFLPRSLVVVLEQRMQRRPHDQHFVIVLLLESAKSQLIPDTRVNAITMSTCGWSWHAKRSI